MIAFAGMLLDAATKAGIACPEDPDAFESIDEFKDSHPRFWMFCVCQLGASMPYPGVHFNNAKAIADIPEEELPTITFQQLEKRGFSTGYPIP